MANSLSFNQISSILNGMITQVQGGTPANINTGNFVTVAQTALKNGYEPILNAISQMVMRTVFSTRAYNGKFRGLLMDNNVYGNAVRKLQVSDTTYDDDPSWTLTDGESVDQWTVKKANVLQTNFYGAEVDMLQPPSVYKNQLDSAFSSASELGRFWAMITQNTQNMLVQKVETMARGTIANAIASIVASGATGQRVQLITEYNAATGSELTSDTYQAPENYGPFMQWVAGKVQTVCEMMTERTTLFQTTITGHPIQHHTPFSRMKAYFSTEPVIQTQTRVLTELFNTEYMRGIDFERVNFWQSPTEPLQIIATPTYLQADGTLKTAEASTTLDNIYGIVFDEEAMGINIFGEWAQATPMNAKGGYSNMFYHFVRRYFNDFTEKMVLFTLD